MESGYTVTNRSIEEQKREFMVVSNYEATNEVFNWYLSAKGIKTTLSDFDIGAWKLKGTPKITKT